MRLAKSQAHQPFPGFFGPGFFLSNHRCKSLFQSVCPDSNRAFSLLGRCIQPAPFLNGDFSDWQRYFSQKKTHKELGVVLLVLTD